MTVQQIVDGAQSISCCIPKGLQQASVVYLLNQILSGNSSNQGVSLLANLYDHWRFDGDTNGVNGHNFTVVTPVFESGKVTASAIRFNIATPAGTGTALGTAGDLVLTQSISFAFWFNFATFQTSTQNNLVGNHVGPGTSGVKIRGRTSPSLTIQQAGSVVNSPTAFVLGNWVFVAGGIDLITPTRWITIDGAAKTIGGVPVSDATPVNNLYIGKDPLVAQVCDMRMNSLSIWRGKVLSAADIAYLYNAGAGRNYPFFT
jgi:hypothetical protein